MNEDVNKLIELADSIGWAFESFTPSSQGNSATYIDTVLAGKRPVETDYTSSKDFDHATRSWARRGRIASDVYSTFEELLTQEIKRINKIRAELEADE